MVVDKLQQGKRNTKQYKTYSFTTVYLLWYVVVAVLSIAILLLLHFSKIGLWCNSTLSFLLLVDNSYQGDIKFVVECWYQFGVQSFIFIILLTHRQMTKHFWLVFAHDQGYIFIILLTHRQMTKHFWIVCEHDPGYTLRFITGVYLYNVCHIKSRYFTRQKYILNTLSLTFQGFACK